MKAVFVADESDRDSGLLGGFLQGSGAMIRYLYRERIPSSSIDGDVVILLGSNRSAHDPRQAEVVATETELVREYLANGVPVIGICYGAQLLARALGGDSRRGTLAECGWTQVYSNHHELCPPGSWAQMHHDIIVPAETSTVIGWSPAGPQAFIDDRAGARAVGWQFHPELTLPTFRRWLSERYSGSENADQATTLADATRGARDSSSRATALFLATFRHLGLSNDLGLPDRPRDNADQQANGAVSRPGIPEHAVRSSS